MNQNVIVYYSPRSNELVTYNLDTHTFESEFGIFQTSKYMLFVFEQTYIEVGRYTVQ